MTEALVSIILPTRDRETSLVRSVQSVIKQTYPRIELLVIDDGSVCPVSTQLSRAGISDERIRIFTVDYGNASEARNVGLEYATGDFIGFLDDDDEFFSEKISEQLMWLGANLDVDMVYCWSEIIGEKTEFFRPEASGFLFREFLKGQPVNNISTFMIRRRVIDFGIRFDKRLLRGNDGDFLRSASQFFSFGFVPKVLVRYYTNGTGRPRLSLNDNEGLRRDLFSWEYRLEKFRSEIISDPDVEYYILAQIIRRNAHLLEFRKCFGWMCKGFKVSKPKRCLGLCLAAGRGIGGRFKSYLRLS